MDTLFGEGQTGPKILLFLVVVLGLLAVAFWLLRRFGGGRLGSAATRGRQPRLALIDQAAIDNRRRLVLIRRDNVEHLLIIGGPTDVVVEQNIVRAAAAALAPARPAATDTLPRAVPLGEDTMWPLQPETAPKPEGAPRVEPSLRAEPAPRPSASAGPKNRCNGRETPRRRRRRSWLPCLPRPRASHGPSIRSQVWRKSSRAYRRRRPSRPGSSRVQTAASRAPAAVVSGRSHRCFAAAQRPESVRDGATAGGRAASSAQVR